MSENSKATPWWKCPISEAKARRIFRIFDPWSEWVGGFGKEVLEDPWDWYIIPIHEGLIFMGSIHGW